MTHRRFWKCFLLRSIRLKLVGCWSGLLIAIMKARGCFLRKLRPSRTVPTSHGFGRESLRSVAVLMHRFARLDRLSICRAASALHDASPSAAVDGPSGLVCSRTGGAAAGFGMEGRRGWMRGGFQSPHAKPLSFLPALKWVLRLVRRVVAAEAILLLTVALCVCAGFPAIVTAFFAALVEFCASVFIAVRTFVPVFRKFKLGRH